jgi:hypothetical protein
VKSLCESGSHLEVCHDDSERCYPLIFAPPRSLYYPLLALISLRLTSSLVSFSPLSASPPGFHLPDESVTKWTFLDLIFILNRHLLDLAPNDSLRLDACLGITAKLVDQIEVVAEGGWLEVLQDTGAVKTSNLGMFLRRVRQSCFLPIPPLAVSRLVISSSNINSRALYSHVKSI